MSSGAAPSLLSQLKVHFLYCSANLWLIVELLSLSDPVYPCCCIVCDLPTELSRSHHCLTLTSSGWDTLQKLQTPVRLTSLKLFRSTYKPTGLKPISRILHLKTNNLCGAPNYPEHPPSLSQRQLPILGPKSIQNNKTFRARLLAALNRATREG